MFHLLQDVRCQDVRDNLNWFGNFCTFTKQKLFHQTSLRRRLNLTTLAERRIWGDLIQVFKALNGFSSLGSIFNISRSGLKLISSEV